MDFDPEQLLEILNQPGVVQQAAPRFPLNQQVEIAPLVGFTTGDRAEHAQVAGPAPLGNLEDIVPPVCAQCPQSDHSFIVRQIRLRVHFCSLPGEIDSW